MPAPSPWHQLPPEALAVPGHDPATCPVCGPTHGTPAWGRGCDAANMDARAVTQPQEALTP